MKISELKPGQGSVEVEASVEKVGEVREFNKFGKQLRVATAIIKDDSGSMELSLWNEDIDKVKAGDKIKITNGFVKEFQGNPQLTTGREGKLEVVGAGEAPAEPEAEEKPAEEEKKEE